MSKAGFRIPEDLETKLERHVPWGMKQKVIEGMLRLLVAELERGDYSTWHRAVEAYHAGRNERPSHVQNLDTRRKHGKG